MQISRSYFPIPRCDELVQPAKLPLLLALVHDAINASGFAGEPLGQGYAGLHRYAIERVAFLYRAGECHYVMDERQASSVRFELAEGACQLAFGGILFLRPFVIEPDP